MIDGLRSSGEVERVAVSLWKTELRTVHLDAKVDVIFGRVWCAGNGYKT
jgi:hypothetical protein